MLSKGNLNRIWVVLGAIEALESPTLLNISNAVGMPRPSVNDVLKKLLDGQVAGVMVKKKNKEYVVVEWLDFKDEVSKVYKKHSLTLK